MISKQLREFELLNTVSESIYELNGLRVLIILKDGSNLTSWDDVENSVKTCSVRQILLEDMLV